MSPLLSNLYMLRFILGWKSLGHQQRLGARIVNYADDFVICCRGTADEAMRVMRYRHDYGVRPSSTIALERATNPFLKCADADSFLSLKQNWPSVKLNLGLK